MKHWIQIIILGVLISFVKASHFMRLVMLAGLGLAGLWMMHTLAQDFNTIRQSGFGSGTFGGGGEKVFNDDEIKVFKRSINEAKMKPKINWETVIRRDPASCARSFICQLEASKENLTEEETIILNLTRTAADDTSWASQQLQEALKNGNTVNIPDECMKLYRFCPYTKKMMMRLLKVFANR